MIQVNNLNLSYAHKKQPVHVLKGVSLSVNKGEIYGIIGKSGAGKSTLLKSLNLIEIPDSGNIFIDDVDITTIKKDELRKIRQKIGMIFQGFNLLNSKTAFDNVALPLVLQGKTNKAEIKTKVESLLDLVGLSCYGHKYPESLSGGQKQRLGIARALTTDPKILLSDEATSALDPETTNSILELLLTINENLGLTIVLITHEIDVIRKICDKVAVIDKGIIVESGNVIDVILHPKHELTRKLIIEEESHRYLEQVSDFYKFNKNDNSHLVVISFIGNTAFEPILSGISRNTGVTFSILRGELGRIKKMPFGQMLVEVRGSVLQLEQSLKMFKQLSVHYELIA
ncbi:MAG: methionine transporter ATP-binding protein [Burkholderiales bacterium]|nr:methionine transporter ATP-binding protein [Burkholderiales bacterium]